MSQRLGIRPAPAFLGFLFLTLTACGGGGGAATSSSTGPSNPQEPSQPQPTYSGIKTAATMDGAFASTRVFTVFPALQFLAANAKEFQVALPPGPYANV